MTTWHSVDTFTREFLLVNGAVVDPDARPLKLAPLAKLIRRILRRAAEDSSVLLCIDCAIIREYTPRTEYDPAEDHADFELREMYLDLGNRQKRHLPEWLARATWEHFEGAIRHEGR